MAVPLNIIVMWPGSNGSIPSGWSRITSMDSKYPKGTPSGTNPNGTGGNSNHNHSGGNHTHSDSHSHGNITTTSNGVTGGTPYLDNPSHESGPVYRMSAKWHEHTIATGSGGATGGSTATTWASGGNDPSYYRMIFIGSDGTPGGYPNTCVTFFNSGSAPEDWAQHNASSGKIILGASGGGAGGGTGGGGSHTHASNASHSHSIAAHGHTGSGSTSGNATYTKEGGWFSVGSVADHTHSNPDLASGGGETSGGTSVTSGGTTYEPPSKTLKVIQNTSGEDLDTIGVIAMWLQSLSSIPVQYILCDGSSGTQDMRNKFVKASSSAGSNAGSDGHNHGAASHTHSASTHTHNTGSLGGHSGGNQTFSAYNGNSYIRASHGHNVPASGSGTSNTSGSATISAAGNSEPPYRYIAFVEQIENISAAGFSGGPSGAGYYGSGVAHF